MHAPPEHLTASSQGALLSGGALAGRWVLEPRTPNVRFVGKAPGFPVTGCFRELSGRNGRP